jgi:hypothetical protein
LHGVEIRCVFYSFRFVSFRFVSFRFVSFRFVSFRSFRFVSFRFVSFRFVSFCFVLFRFVVAEVDERGDNMSEREQELIMKGKVDVCMQSCRPPPSCQIFTYQGKVPHPPDSTPHRRP